MFRTIRCFVMVMLLLAVAVPAAQAQEVPPHGELTLESAPSLWTEVLNWVSALFTGGGPFIDPNGGDYAAPLSGDGAHQVDGGPFIDPNGRM